MARSEITLTKTRLSHGTWEGRLHIPEDQPPPQIEVIYAERKVEGVAFQQGGAATEWVIRIPVPQMAISDGIHSFLIRDAGQDRVLGSFAILAGDALGDSLQSEVDLLRAELDLLKRAFRRHCVETT